MSIKEVVTRAGLISIVARDEPGYNNKVCNFCCAIRKSKYVVADVSRPDCVNVMYEVALSHALCRRVAFLFNGSDHAQKQFNSMPWNIRAFGLIEYGPTDGGVGQRLRRKLARWFIQNASLDADVDGLEKYLASVAPRD